MASERSAKRQRTDPESAEPSSEPDDASLPPAAPMQDSQRLTDKQSQRSSWYAPWSRKVPSITKVAHESTGSASNTASEVDLPPKDASSPPKPVRSPSLAMTLGKGRSSRSSLADATTTMVHAEVKSPGREPKRMSSDESTDKPLDNETPPKVEDIPDRLTQESNKESKVEQKQEEASQKKDEASMDKQQESHTQRSGWLGWFAKADATGQEPEAEVAPGPSKSAEQIVPDTTTTEEVATTATATDDSEQHAQPVKRSWFPIWSGEPAAKTEGPESNSAETEALAGVDQAQEDVQHVDTKKDKKSSETQQEDLPSTETVPPPTLPHDEAKPSAWAFWSRNREANNSSASIDKPREGEIAVSDTPSQSQPSRTSISVPKANQQKKLELKKTFHADSVEPEVTVPKKAESVTSKRRDSTASDRRDSIASKSSEPLMMKKHKKVDSKNETVTTKAESSNAIAVAIEPTEKRTTPPTASNRRPSDCLLPDFYSTLKAQPSPTLLARLASMFSTAKEPEIKHLSLAKETYRIKNAVAIGVHGYFPAPFIRSVIGQPTGTSIKFADMASKAIKRWTIARGYKCRIKTCALEGEGRIAERLALLWKLLLNWMDEIRKADFVMVACHSQGVPVAIMLVAKLIEFGCVNSARIGICAMAGVNMGPFSEYKPRWIGGSAAELFEFTDPESQVSKDYLAALEAVLKFGARLTFIGSIDDQLVSMESSLFAPVSHPHIFRAVSIDARTHAPNFISHLVGFALKLRNLGVRDHGLIRELSSPLAGSLYSGEGHSRIYEDDEVYDLSLAFSLETTAVIGMPIFMRPISNSTNPYVLPFAMRGVLEENLVKNELEREASKLILEFDEWKPGSRVLRDVKFRLEGIRSKT